MLFRLNRRPFDAVVGGTDAVAGAVAAAFLLQDGDGAEGADDLAPERLLEGEGEALQPGAVNGTKQKDINTFNRTG